MPVYNARRFLTEAVESVLGQTLGDFELLIVDDGSTDGSTEVLRRLAGRDRRIRLVVRENRGLIASLNEMIGMAGGDLIARMDADDVSLPGRFAAQVEYLDAHPEVICLGGSERWIDEVGHPLLVNRRPTDDAAIQEQALSGICPMCHPTVMMRREAVLGVGGYDPTMHNAEDLDLWLRMGEVGRLANLEEVVLDYRLHGQSETHKNEEVVRAQARAAVDRSCERRGLDRRCPPLGPIRVASSRFDCSLMYGWWGFGAGHRSAAVYHGMQAIRRKPWRPAGWKLLAYGVLATPRAGGGAGLGGTT